MKSNVRKAAALGLMLPMLFVAGCAWQKDVDALRGQVTTLEGQVKALQETTKAAQSEAKAAAEKADRILRESLRK
jgi:outer membrane murein-binding lipoprotein Lpp